MKTALITGGTRGIGKAIADQLQSQYHVITVGRSQHATECGDLLDPKFVNSLVEKYTPDVFINNAGMLSKNLELMMKMNGVIAVELLMKFYSKMTSGTIINISSHSAYKTNLAKESEIRIAYATAKKYLRDASIALNASKNKDVRVMCVSPGATHTDMLHSITDYQPIPEHYNNYNWNESICWIRPNEVADAIQWLLNLPPWISVPELVLDNHYSNAINW